jgi:hypothetical protein
MQGTPNYMTVLQNDSYKGGSATHESQAINQAVSGNLGYNAMPQPKVYEGKGLSPVQDLFNKFKDNRLDRDPRNRLTQTNLNGIYDSMSSLDKITENYK